MVNKVRNAVWLVVGVMVAVWAVTSVAGLVRAGPMEPSASPGPTYKTLTDVEPRTAIWQPDPGGFPIVIDQPGSYYLASDITGESGADGIQIMVDDVTLDLNGFTLDGVPGSFNGVVVPASAGSVNNLSIYNGTIQDWGGDGVCGANPCGMADDSRYRDLMLMGNGGAGIRTYQRSQLTGLQAQSNGADGIKVEGDSIVTGCVSTWNTGTGIYATDSVVADNRVSVNDDHGIRVGADTLVVGNLVANNGGAGIYGLQASNRIEGNDVVGNSAAGIRIVASLGSSLIIRNSATDNGANPATDDYDIVAGNTVGPIVVGPQDPIASTNPWANFRY